MREAIWAERALGCPDRGVLGGFSAAVSRWLHADPKAGGKSRSWAMAAVASYRLKNAAERDEVCARLAGIVPVGNASDGSGVGLDAPLTTLAGVGEKLAERLHGLGLRTLGDLLDHLPREYIDRSETRGIRDLKVGQVATVLATVREAKVERFRSGRRAVKAVISDGTGYIECIWWGQEWRVKQLREGTQAAFSGKVESTPGRLQFANPAYDLLGSSGEMLHTGRIVPIYPATEGISPTMLRRWVHTLFGRIGSLADPLPAQVRAESNLLPKDLAYRLAHFPEDTEQIPDARRRLVFEELFTLQVGLALRKRHVETDLRGIAHKASDLPDRFLGALPFAPTKAQERAMREIARDMAEPRPMHRLLQGDVGSGKTLVAVHAALRAVGSGSQAAIMAPTEVLAEQHARKIREFLEPVGVDVGLLTSSVAASQRRDTLMRLAAADLNVICGTHALISEGVAFKRLGLAVVDEQHRFGLGQRMLLRAKGQDPDVLIMTATPIPRTLALTLYGDLDMSVLDELPAGRQPIETVVVDPSDGPARARAYEIVRQEVAEGRRAYVVCALVDESDSLAAKAAVAEAERLRTQVFPDLAVGLLHGQMRPAEKDQVMDAFRRGEISVLISTTVIEVGVDVPEATVMLIENAERFGLSQLHQLRGRVGRGSHPSRCILFADPSTEESQMRLAAIAESTDGFFLADRDLEIRGEGTIFGLRQAGMTDLKVARLGKDREVLVESREAAFALVDADPKLTAPQHAMLRAEVQRRFGDDVEWLFHG